MTSKPRHAVSLLLVGGALFLMLAVSAILGTWVAMDRQQTLRRTFAENRGLATTYKAYLEQAFGSVDSTLEVIALDQKERSEPRIDDHLQAVIAARMKASSFLLDLLVINAHGQPLNWTRPAKPPHFAEQRCFQGHRDRPDEGLVVSRASPAPTAPETYVFTLSRSLRHPDGTFAGVTVAIVESEKLSHVLAELLVTPDSTVALVHDDAAFAARAPYRAEAIGKTVPYLASLPGGMPQETEHRDVSPVDGSERLISQLHLKGYPFSVAVTQGVNSALAGWRKNAIRIGWVWLTLMGIIGFGARYLARQFERQARTAAALKESEEKFHLLFDATGDATFVNLLPGPGERPGRFIEVNEGACRRLGYARDELLERTPGDITAPESVGDLKEIETQLATNGSAAFERIMIAKDGTRLPVEIVARIFHLGGRPALLGVARDITERKQAQEHIEELLAFNQRIIETSILGIMVYGPDGRCIHTNPAACAMIGGPAERILGQNFRQLESWSASGLLEAAERVLETGIPESLSVHVKTSFGKEAWLDCAMASFTGRGGQNLLVIADDATESRRLESEMRAARASAEAANRAKSEFLANMSHEIRTPMNAVLGLAQLLGQTSMDGTQAGYVDKIVSSGRALLTIINDILDLSKVEAGRLELETVSFRLDDVLRDLGPTVAAMAEGKEIEILFRAEAGVPNYLEGDPLRLRQVLLNLLANAVKFTADGYILLRIAAVPARTGRIALRFTVRDTGIGIGPDHQRQLFQPFSQADASTTRRFGGTGLGLAICRHLVGMMGGEIGVVSELGVGSEFWFTAAFGQPALPDIKVVDEDPPGPFRVLLVDDHTLARGVLADALTRLGWPVSAAPTVEAAVTAVDKAILRNEPFDLILADWGMPGMPVDEIRRRVKERALPTPLVIAMGTPREAKSFQPDDQSALDGFLVKPVLPTALLETLIDIEGRMAEEAMEESVQRAREVLSPETMAELRVLLVEDNLVNQEVARGMLQKAGATVETAENGRLALERLEKGPNDFNLVLMDVQMPEMDGYEATRAIRERWGPRLPVIAVTAGVLPGDREKCRAAGMNGFIGKPFEIRAAIAAIRQVLEEMGGNTSNL